MVGSSGHGLNQLSQAATSSRELLDLGGGGDSCHDWRGVGTGVGDICDGGRGYLHHLICQFRELVQDHGAISRREHHPDVSG